MKLRHKLLFAVYAATFIVGTIWCQWISWSHAELTDRQLWMRYPVELGASASLMAGSAVASVLLLKRLS